MLFASWTWQNCTELDNNIAQDTVTFQCGLSLCQQSSSSSTFEQEQVFPPYTSCSPSFAAPDKWHSAVPHHWHNANLPSFFLKDQTRDNLQMHSRDFKVDVAILSIQNLWWHLWCTHLCAVKHCHGEVALQTLFLWDELNKGKHSDFTLFQYSRQEFTAAC